MSSAPHSEGPEAKRPRHEGIVDLDVGGTPFRTTNMTLQKSPFFANLLDSGFGKLGHYCLFFFPGGSHWTFQCG